MEEITRSLLDMYEKHKAYLEKQIELHKYIWTKTNTTEQKASHDAYVNALDNLNTLFGDE